MYVVPTIKNKDKPRYTHNNQDDIFLGYLERYDLWFSNKGALTQVIARYGHLYCNAIVGLGSNLDPLVEARKRAKDLGLF